MKISIALCTYNGGKWLQQQLDSLSAQTYPPYEIVVCDDGSSDDTVDILEAFAQAAPFPVHIYQNPENLGVRGNFSKAIGLCSGEIISLCDQDDIWLPGKLEKKATVFQSQPEVGMVVVNAQVVDAQLNSKGYTLLESARVTDRMIRQVNDGMGLEVMLKRYYAWGNSLAFRAKYRRQVLPLAPHWSHDGWISLVMAAVARVAILPEPLLLYRLHGNNQAGTAPVFSYEPMTAIHTAMASQWQGNKARDLWIAIEHLQQIEGIRDMEHVAALIKRKIKHMEARGTLPKSRFQRILPGLKELTSGRYHDYSSGFRSFAKDILAS